MSRPLEPDINAYGTYGRVEALADWLEVAALAGRRVTRAQLEDMIFDNGWTRLSPQQFLLPDGMEEEATPESWVEAVHSTLQRREQVLGVKWPFEIVGSWRVKKRPGANTVVPYTAMLALSVAHAWNVATTHKPEVLLEATIARALSGFGLAVAPVGTGTSFSGGFPEVMRQAAASLGIRCDPDAAPRKKSAKDEGVDTLALLGWPSDPRLAGQWVFVGQATVARSNEWYKKLMEPRRDHWRSRLIQPLEPQRFLVVPHQVASEYLTHLVGNDTGVVIDRLRLALVLDDVTGEERLVLDEILAAGVSDGRAAA
ncbi:hypothetical protein LG324_01455 [Phycicoccus jejuensis]|uniref:hypothetical protein n=1 Tax=Phycicoccus jejuensis TaxID=367299 RepID=UPI00384AE1A7